jgi:hypothetical protein
MKKWIMTMADEPEAMRYGFDGFGYKYIDSGSGSDWRTRHHDAEPLYASQPTQSDALLEGDTQTILYLLGVRHGQEDERAKIAAEASQPTQSDALREALEKVITSSNLEKAHEIAATTLEELRQPTQSDDEAYDLGKRDGYEKAVQDIDMLTGGDGEYCYSTIEGERHCPNPDSMKARIAERFNSQPTQSDALREALEAAPLIGRTESVYDFMERQDAWLKGPYRAAMQEQSK